MTTQLLKLASNNGQSEMSVKSSDILILGAGCTIGQRLHAALGVKRVVGTYRRNIPQGGVRFELPDMDLSAVIEQPKRFSHAVILHAVTNPDACFNDRAYSASVNVAGTISIIDWLWRHDIVPVFASSQSIFSGEKGNYRENETPRPIIEYGRQKREVEQHLIESDNPYVILRISRSVGTEPGDGTLFTDWLSDIHEGRRIRCATDDRFSPVFIDDVVTSFMSAIEQNLRGIFHVAGPDSLSRIEMLNLLIEELRVHGPCDAKIERCKFDDFPTSERRPLDTSMHADKLSAAIGLRFRSLREICAEAVLGEILRRSGQ